MKLSKVTFFIAIAIMMVFKTSFAGSVTAEKMVSPVAVDGSLAFNMVASQDEDYFSDYDAFIARLTELTSSTDYSARLDQFWSDLIATGNFPFAIGTQVAFLYRGSASKINWAGEFNGWDMNADAGNRLGVSDIWLLEKEFPADTKCEYKIVRNGSEWLADPHNPHPLVGDFQNSELWMPEYEIPSETIRDPDAPRGTLSNNLSKHSSYLGYTCQYRVYTPASYNSLTNLPVIYCTDGQNYLNDSMGKMVIILDNLIAEGTIEPVIAVFLDPRDPNNLSNDRRGSEYLYNPEFADYVSKELIPDIDAAYKTNPSADVRAILGASYGACNAAYFCVRLPDYFHLIGMQSPLIHPNAYDVISELRSSDLEPMKFFMSTGTLNDAEMYCNRLKSVFDQKGKEYEYKTIAAGHTWSNWSQLVGDALTYFYGAGTETASLSLRSPDGGEYFIAGSSIQIIWEATSVSTVKIEYSTDNGASWTEIIASASAGPARVNWIVPDVISDQCKIKISDSADETVWDESGHLFTIGEGGLICGPYTVDDNTILLLHFENNLINSSPLSADGVSHGSGVSYGSNTPPSLGQCLKLNNSNSSYQSYVSIPHNDHLNLSGSWTIEAWFYFNSMGSDAALNPTMISKASDSNQNYFLWYHTSWGQIKGQYTNSVNIGKYVGIGNNPITTGKWYHIAYIKDAANSTEKLIIHDENRELVTEQEIRQNSSETTPILNNEDVLIGKLFSTSTFYVDGYLDEIRISNVVRSFERRGLDADFSADAPSGFAPLTVHFTDLSTQGVFAINEWSWDFDKDGIVDSNDQNPSFTYSEAGSYAVSLTVGDGTHTNTEVKTDYITVREPIVSDPAKGTLSGNILKHSSYLGYTCQYRVYTPANYNSLTNLPTIYATDGQNYLNDSMGKMVIVLDNLIAEGAIEPVIAVFLDPRNPNNLSNDRRGSEYLYNPEFADYVSKELIPDIDAAYKTNPSADVRAILGASYGACNAAYFCVRLPDYFHLIGMQSPLIHPNAYDVISELRSSDLEPMKFFMSTGTLNDAERYCDRLKSVFDQKGKEYEYKTVVAGHTWSNWSQLVDDVLTYFYSTNGDVEVTLPGDFDGDGQVGLVDFSMFVRYYGLSKEHGDFDVLYDLDGDGRIGLRDFSIFAGNYGRSIGSGKAMPVAVGENGEGALSIDLVDCSEYVNLTVRLEGVRALQGYSFNVRYASDRFDFRGAERVGTDLSDNGSPLWPLLVRSPIPGEVLVADVLRGDEEIGGGDALVKLRFRHKGSAAHAQFTVTKGMFLDAQGKIHALESGEAVLLLREFALLQAFPNPFNASTVIRIQLPEASEVRLRVYNLLGQEVRRLMEGKVKAGAHSVLWDGRDNQDRTLATGMYLVRLEAGAFAQLRKIVLVR